MWPHCSLFIFLQSANGHTVIDVEAKVACMVPPPVHVHHQCQLFLLQIAHPQFLDKIVPVLEEQEVRLVHARPGFDNVSMHGDVFNQVCLP